MHYKRLSRWEPFVLRIALCRCFSFVPPLYQGSHINPLTISIIIPIISGTYPCNMLRFLRRNIENVSTISSGYYFGTMNITFNNICELLARTRHWFLNKHISGEVFNIRQIHNVYFPITKSIRNIRANIINQNFLKNYQFFIVIIYQKAVQQFSCI